MARSNNTSLPISAYSVTSFTNTGGTGNITFNISLSVESSTNLIGYLSGNPSVATPTLSATLAPTALSTLSAVNNIVYNWGSILGGSSFYPYILTSSVIPATSSFSLGLDFNSLDFLTNTNFYLSGITTSLILSAASTTDNPLFDRGFIVNSPNESNNTFRTVAEHLRRWNLNG